MTDDVFDSFAVFERNRMPGGRVDWPTFKATPCRCGHPLGKHLVVAGQGCTACVCDRFREDTDPPAVTSEAELEALAQRVLVT